MGDGRLVVLDAVNRAASDTQTACTDCVVVARVTTPGTGGVTRSTTIRASYAMDPLSVVGASGRYVHFLAYAAGAVRSTVADVETGAVLRDSTNENQALWGGQLWTMSATDGKVTGVDVRTGATVATADLGTSCRFTALEVVGKWISARCAGDARAVVIHDREKRTSVWIRATYEPLHLGDGFVAYQVLGGESMLYAEDVRSGESEGHELGALPYDGEDHDGRWWSLDRFGGGIAFIDRAQAVRVTGLGGVTSRLTAIDADTPAADIRSGAWKPRWWLSKPGSSWTLTLRHKASGKTVRTLTGGEARGIVAPSWDGKDGAGKYVANGAYAWSLTVKPADGHGADLTVSGGVAVSGAAAVWRDMAGDDGFGDLLAMDTAGAMSLYRGTGTGGVSSRVKVGGGWGVYSALVGAGDVSGDGRADLLVRTTDGKLYRYSSTGTGAYGGRVLIGTGGWNTFKGLF
ncbi:hypothetical protein HHL19_10175 [Streptomyces sp. R302]|uniref:FlgD immunoglobulin-like domain containing protein n=1 Tax=unclassified Streptomyces TaxID=2593676 RepID=UPI00145CD3BF|nr:MULTISPECIES: FlgD immunoglobulin-like domain containing protein [unclassified Streptomyces]NML50034.1 hypothetical protein [Streptomyces sp. R301]NML79025.1 hypothetical protein [Streptomyces sp. R302]